MPIKKKRVVIALSGGVDSSVAAYLLIKEGYEVIGVFMKNWHDETVTISNECPWLEDSYDAMMVCEKLKIPFQTVDLSKQYKERIVNYMFNEYENGNTPNPDVLCNREIKFDIFLKIAMSLDAQYIATGHYARIKHEEINGKRIYSLHEGYDNQKDQSYFLCQLSQFQLSKALFPIGELSKKMVRDIAKKQKLVTANKKDSQGLCFIGKVKLPDFLQQKLKLKKGKIIKIPYNHKVYSMIDSSDFDEKKLPKMSKPYNYNIEDGEVVGFHNGAHFYTVGQRKGLAIGGSEMPMYVIKTDTKKNIIYVGEGKNHPGLYRKTLFVQRKNLHFIRKDKFFEDSKVYDVDARIRYRQPLQKAKLIIKKNGAYLLFKEMQSAIAKGQFAAWYDEGELIGSGEIS